MGFCKTAEFGTLRDSATAEAIRPATKGERDASDESEARGSRGHILILEGDVTRRCYVD
jgi:hypothetical protein